jgi:hypothetical protein
MSAKQSDDSVSVQFEWRSKRLGSLRRAIACCAIGILLTQNAEAQELLSTPPLQPLTERRTLDDTAFAAECIAELRKLEATKGWRIGTQVVTRSEPWGLVWRADFEMGSGPTSPLINRAICWKHADGHVALVFAIGQNVPPL